MDGFDEIINGINLGEEIAPVMVLLDLIENGGSILVQWKAAQTREEKEAIAIQEGLSLSQLYNKISRITSIIRRLSYDDVFDVVKTSFEDLDIESTHKITQDVWAWIHA